MIDKGNRFGSSTRAPHAQYRDAGCMNILQTFLTRFLYISYRLNSHSSLKKVHTMATDSKLIIRICDPKSITFPGSLDASDLPKISSQETEDALKLAAHHLVELEDVVAFPTETVYGLGANALSPNAVSRIFSTKGRPQDNPLIVHVSSLPMLRDVLPKDYTISPVYQALISKFWPGPLSVLFPANADVIPKSVTAGHATVAIRMPSHPVARAVIAFSGKPIAAPSANTSGKPSPTRAEHVVQDTGSTGKLSLLLDGGPCAVGVESTVVDGLDPDGNLRILRPGGVTVEDLEKVVDSLNYQNGRRPKVLVHRRDYEDKAIEIAPTTPGMKYRHYSPSVPVIMLLTISKDPTGKASLSFADAIKGVSESLKTKGDSLLKLGLLATSDSPLWEKHPIEGVDIEKFVLGKSNDPATSAARLFDGLLTLERRGVRAILVEEIAEDHEGLAFMNRARKAAGESIYVY